MRAVSLGFLVVGGLILVWSWGPAHQVGVLPADEKPPRLVPGEQKRPKVVLVIHGGAGVLTREEMKGLTLESGEELTRGHYEAALADALEAGYKAWQDGKDSGHVDAVEAAIRVMEDSELFNAGRGAALNHDGQAELDAAIMEGMMGEPKSDREGKQDFRKRAGAVAAVTHIKNPISAARAVMEMPDQRHVLLVGEGAEWFALSQANIARYRIEKVSNVYFWTGRRLNDIRKAVEAEDNKEKGPKPGARGKRRDQQFGTVGAVANKNSCLAAGTSTGGLTNKLRGRVGDTPVIGGGTYADDRACGVSCTGTGELFIRHAVAHDVVARMLYGMEVSVDRAAQDAIKQLPDEVGGVGGLIALDKDYRHAFCMSKLSLGMYRGYATEEGEFDVAIYQGDEWKRMKRGKDNKWEGVGPEN